MSGRRIGFPALGPAVDEPDDLAAVGDEDVAVDVQVVDLVHVPGDGQPIDGRRREAAAVRRREVVDELLLGRIDDVQVVEPGARDPQERPDRPDVVAPARPVRHRDLDDRALARLVGRPPAPEHVLRVDHEQVAGGAERHELRRAFGRPRRLRPVAVDERGGPRPEIDPIDRFRGSVQDVRDAARAQDHVADVERDLAVGERDDRRRGDGNDAVQPIQAGLGLLLERVDRRRGDFVLGGRVEGGVGRGEEVEGSRRIAVDEIDARREHLADVVASSPEGRLTDGE